MTTAFDLLLDASRARLPTGAAATTPGEGDLNPPGDWHPAEGGGGPGETPRGEKGEGERGEMGEERGE